MNWSSLAEFAAMGGYGLYVWGAFGVTAAVMVGEMLALRARHLALRATEPDPDPQAEPMIDYREGAA